MADTELFSGLVRLHMLYHASRGPVFGREMIRELRRHGSELSAGQAGEPQWLAPPESRWDYKLLGAASPIPKPDHVIPMVSGKINGGKGGFNHWTIKGKPYGEQGPAPGSRQAIVTGSPFATARTTRIPSTCTARSSSLPALTASLRQASEKTFSRYAASGGPTSALPPISLV